jgi:hypothetical protein
MSRKPARMIGLAFVTVLATGPAAAYADQWTAQRVHGTVMNTDRNAHREAGRPASSVGGVAATLRHDGRRTRIEHTALDQRASELNNRATR